MLKSLSFVSPENVFDYYKEINNSYKDKDFKKISMWFKENYIQRKKNLKGPKMILHFGALLILT